MNKIQIYYFCYWKVIGQRLNFLQEVLLKVLTSADWQVDSLYHCSGEAHRFSMGHFYFSTFLIPWNMGKGKCTLLNY